MKSNYRWKKNLFTNVCKIYDSSKQIGIIKKKNFSQESQSEINNEKYNFKPKNIFNQETEIRNSENKLIGSIKYNTWRNKAIIEIANSKYNWAYKNVWNTKWEINSNDSNIKYNSSNNSIESNFEEKNDLEVLTGLYIYNYYQQNKIVVFIPLFLPIIINLLH